MLETLKSKNEDMPLINEKIRFDKIQTITSDGRNLGVIARDEALRLARVENLDLVILAEKGNDGFPVAKIMDFGKALYSKKKQQHEAKKHQKTIQVKELKLRPKIGEHDYQTKINQAIAFLQDGKHLKVTLMFRGREAAMRDERGQEMLAKMDQSFEAAGLTKVAYEKDMKTAQMWTRIYYLKK